MNRQIQLSGLMGFFLILHVPLSLAQDEASNEATEPKSAKAPAGQEVEVNEDNYRQFMELKDARGQRNMLPEDAFKAGSGAQKLDKLPEESQKHLRNQLREIIVQGDQWQPGDENTQYPYVPSNTATSNPSLQEQEAEAWGELVDNYHQREAEIYENSARSQAAMAAGSASGGGTGNNGGSSGAETGPGGAGQGGEGQQSSQPIQGEQGGAADSYAPNAQNDPNATSTKGVSQNAMEFLTGKGKQVTKAGETQASTGGSTQNSSEGETQTQQTEQHQDEPGSHSAESSTASAIEKSENQSSTGTSQNALEYLAGGQNQESDVNGNAPGTEPLPELPSLREPVPASNEDTLTIQDLMNAQGVRNATSTGSPAPGTTSGPLPVDDPDKDRDG